MSKKVKIALLIVIVAVAGSLAWGAFSLWQSSTRGPKLQSTSASQFGGYECSRPIDGEWEWAKRVGMAGEPGYFFKPSSQEDVQKYCRLMWVEEYRAVLDILRREDIHRLITQYDTAEAWVKALGHRYIKDKDYLTRILPTYSDVKIDCIIVVHSPEGTRFFIENGEVHKTHDDHQYLEVPAAEFLAALNRASDEDVTNFWLGLH